MANVKARQRVERSIARRFILDALRAGYVLSVYDGEEVTLKQSTSAKAILAAMFTVDDEYLLLSRPDDPQPEVTVGAFFRPTIHNVVGWVRFVYGNDGYDVISNYTTNLETIMAGANKLADRYAD